MTIFSWGCAFHGGGYPHNFQMHCTSNFQRDQWRDRTDLTNVKEIFRWFYLAIGFEEPLLQDCSADKMEKITKECKDLPSSFLRSNKQRQNKEIAGLNVQYLQTQQAKQAAIAIDVVRQTVEVTFAF